MKLNLGSSDRHLPGYTSVDIAPRPAGEVFSDGGFQQADLSGPWPWPDSSVEAIRAFDIIEHIGDCDHVSRWLCERCSFYRNDILLPKLAPLPKRHQRAHVHVMNEAHRLLVPGGVFDIEVPTTEGPGAWQDPQHVSYWNRHSFWYFTIGHPYDACWKRFHVDYGITACFRVLKEAQRTEQDGVVKLRIELAAVK